jgi:hypothetical protein
LNLKTKATIFTVEYSHNTFIEECGMKTTWGSTILAIVTMLVVHSASIAGERPLVSSSNRQTLSDSTLTLDSREPLLNAWGLDVLVSNDGFGLGTFYRRQFTEDLSGFAMFSISESKEDREFEFFDQFTFQSFTPGKLQRFLVMPLTAGVQYRLFREDIMDNFRPFVNAGAGPTLIFSAPFADLSYDANGRLTRVAQVEFFKSLGRGQAHYTASGFIGVGANFGNEASNVFGVNFRYYFTYLFGDGLPSLYEPGRGNVIARKKSFGGFFITLNVGLAY